MHVELWKWVRAQVASGVVLLCFCATTLDVRADDGPASTSAVGPDIICADLQSTVRYPSVGGVSAYSVGTTACNVGDARIGWEAVTNDHPVWFYNLYRLKDGRFEQIGMSWVVHGFFAVSEDFCGECTNVTDGSELGAGCSSPESASLNGVQVYMSPRSIVDAYNGYFPYPVETPPAASLIERRLQVHDLDLDPSLNAGALYFTEAQYITSDDVASNVYNNASYRRVRVDCRTCMGGSLNGRLCDGSGDCPGGTCPPEGTCSTPGIYYLILEPAWPTQVGQPAIRAWKDNDPDVVETEIQIPGEGLFILAAKATNLGDGYWHYEYALQNFNSHRSASSFSLCSWPGVALKNVGFHDVDYHSGEVYDSTDWTADSAEGGMHWSTRSYASNPNANALRFGTTYDFRFDANAPPDTAGATIELFRPGSPSKVGANTIGPHEFCRNPQDADHDGEEDCFDFCPDTPPGACTCQGMGWCCVGCTGPCFMEERNSCQVDGGTVDECGDPTCKNGCPLLDMDNDRDRDLADFAGLQNCFTQTPSRVCIHRLDVNDDGVVDLLDFGHLYALGLLR